jgi:hypothetical protein
MFILKCNVYKNKYIMFPGFATFNSFVDFIGYNKAALSTKYG